MEVVAPLAMLAVFLGLYAVLNRGRPVQWGWLAAIIGCAAVALVIGLLATLASD
jgi:hypothetical protein